MSLEEKSGFDAKPAATERIEQPKLKKKIIIFTELAKRILIIFLVIVVILDVNDSLSYPIISIIWTWGDKASQALASATGIAVISIQRVRYEIEAILLIMLIFSLPHLFPYLRSPLDPDERKAWKEEKRKNGGDVTFRSSSVSRNRNADLDASWGMHIDSKIFGFDDYSGFGGGDD